MVIGLLYRIDSITWATTEIDTNQAIISIWLTGVPDEENFYTFSGELMVGEQVITEIKPAYQGLIVDRTVVADGGKIDFRIKKFGIGLDYRRIDPFYKSLGSIYFQEDFENILFKLRFAILNGKVKTSSRIGFQRNNLNGLRSNQSNRRIGNVSLSVSPSRNFSINSRYSNYQTDRSDGLIAVNDTLRFSRSTAAFSVSPRFSFGSKDKRSSLSLTVNRQNLIDLLDQESENNNIKNDLVNINYLLKMKDSGRTIGFSVLGNRNLIKDQERTRAGFNTRFSQKLGKDKFTVNLTLGYYQNFLQGESEGSSILSRVGLNFKLSKNIRLNSALNYLNRSGDNGFQNIRATLRLNYSLPSVNASFNKKSKNQKI